MKKKKLPKYKPNQILEITWLDAQTVAGWVSPEESVKDPKATFKTIGYFNGQDDKYIYLAWSIGINNNPDRSKESIPLGCIQKIVRKK